MTLAVQFSASRFTEVRLLREEHMIKLRRFFFTFLAIITPLMIFSVDDSAALDSQQSRTQNQMETTVIHVDKYGVYAPNVVFYWDDEMAKQKRTTLMSAAERLRNKKALITFSATGDLSKDKRPLLVDIVPFKEEVAQTKQEAPQDHRQAATETEVSTESPREERPHPRPVPPRESREIEVEKERIPESEKSYSQAEPPGDVLRSSFGKEEILRFIQKCMSSTKRKDMSSVLSCYSGEVDYYTKGLVDKEFIRRDKGYYFRNWDYIDSSFNGDVVMIVTDQQDVRIVKFTTTFFVENSKKSVSGRAENIWKIQKVNGELKIIDEKQRVLSRDAP
jgi:hypothetical protein